MSRDFLSDQANLEDSQIPSLTRTHPSPCNGYWTEEGEEAALGQSRSIVKAQRTGNGMRSKREREQARESAIKQRHNGNVRPSSIRYSTLRMPEQAG
jgi:hypothetical protein